MGKRAPRLGKVKKPLPYDIFIFLNMINEISETVTICENHDRREMSSRYIYN